MKPVHLNTMPDFRSPLAGPVPVFDASGFLPSAPEPPFKPATHRRAARFACECGLEFKTDDGLTAHLAANEADLARAPDSDSDIHEWEQREDLESERNHAQSQLDSLVEALGFPPDAVSEARALAGILDRDLRVIRSALVNFADAALSREALRLIDRLAPNPDAVCDCGHPAGAHAGVHEGRRVNWKATPCAECSCIDFAPGGRSRED